MLITGPQHREPIKTRHTGRQTPARRDIAGRKVFPMESMIDILFDQLVDSDTAWDIKHDKATQDALNDIYDKSSLPTNYQIRIGEIVSAEAVAQARAGFRAGFVAAMKLCEEVKNKAE